MTYGNISIGTSATSIVSSNTDRATIRLNNNDTVTIYLGGDASVTTSNGYPVEPGATYIENNYTGAIYGIVTSGTADLRYSEE